MWKIFQHLPSCWYNEENSEDLNYRVFILVSFYDLNERGNPASTGYQGLSDLSL
jgi:hypothetical protein